MFKDLYPGSRVKLNRRQKNNLRTFTYKWKNQPRGNFKSEKPKQYCLSKRKPMLYSDFRRVHLSAQYNRFDNQSHNTWHRNRGGLWERVPRGRSTYLLQNVITTFFGPNNKTENRQQQKWTQDRQHSKYAYPRRKHNGGKKQNIDFNMPTCLGHYRYSYSFRFFFLTIKIFGHLSNLFFLLRISKVTKK